MRAACVAGAKVVDICKLGDKSIEDGAAGVYRKAKDGEKIEKGALCAAADASVRAHATWP